MFVCLFKLQLNRIIANQLFIRSQIGCKDIAMVCIFYSHLHLFLPKLEISDRIQLKIAFVFMIIQVKAIDTTCGVTATGGLHSNFFMGILLTYCNDDSFHLLIAPMSNIKEPGFYFAKLR